MASSPGTRKQLWQWQKEIASYHYYIASQSPSTSPNRVLPPLRSATTPAVSPIPAPAARSGALPTSSFPAVDSADFAFTTAPHVDHAPKSRIHYFVSVCLSVVYLALIATAVVLHILVCIHAGVAVYDMIVQVPQYEEQSMFESAVAELSGVWKGIFAVSGSSSSSPSSTAFSSFSAYSSLSTFTSTSFYAPLLEHIPPLSYILPPYLLICSVGGISYLLSTTMFVEAVQMVGDCIKEHTREGSTAAFICNRAYALGKVVSSTVFAATTTCCGIATTKARTVFSLCLSRLCVLHCTQRVKLQVTTVLLRFGIDNKAKEDNGSASGEGDDDEYAASYKDYRKFPLTGLDDDYFRETSTSRPRDSVTPAWGNPAGGTGEIIQGGNCDSADEDTVPSSLTQGPAVLRSSSLPPTPSPPPASSPLSPSSSLSSASPSPPSPPSSPSPSSISELSDSAPSASSPSSTSDDISKALAALGSASARFDKALYYGIQSAWLASACSTDIVTEGLAKRHYGTKHTADHVLPNIGVAFSFTDHSRLPFRKVRDNFSLSDPLMFDNLKLPLVPLGTSKGKSRAGFYRSHNSKLYLKSLKPDELSVLLHILPSYVAYVAAFPNTLLPRFYGCYSIKPLDEASDGRRMDLTAEASFVLMENVFDKAELPVHVKYDIKGSSVNRFASEKEKASGDTVLKDMDLVQNNTRIVVHPQMKQAFMEQLKRDSTFLESHDLMDYSLLLGIHYKVFADTQARIRGASISVWKPFALSTAAANYVMHGLAAWLGSKASPSHNSSSSSSNRDGADPTVSVIPIDVLNQKFDDSFFRGENGGIGALNGDVYFVGIVDILQEYNLSKKMETVVKSVSYGKEGISSVPPHQYRKRFQEWIESIFA